MPTVTITQPSVINVKVDGQSSRVKTINYNQPTAIKDAPDIDLVGAASGDVLTYDANTKIFSAKPIGNNTKFNGNLVPSVPNAYSIGTKEFPWSSLHISGQTLYLGGLVFSQEPQTGSMAITPAPTEEFPDPKGILVAPTGNFVPVDTIDGKPVPTVDYTAKVANTTAYMAFSGYDAGFF
jgi:hypothetical protein